MNAGAAITIPSPGTWGNLTRAVRRLLGSGAPAMPTALVVDDDPLSCDANCALLEQEGVNAVGLLDPYDLLAALSRVRPDLLLLRDPLPLVRASDLCRTIAASAAWQGLPVVIVSEAGRIARRALLDAGADAVVATPDELAEVALRVVTGTARRRSLALWAGRDPTTDALAWAAFFDAATAVVLAAKRRWRPVTLLFVDIDGLPALRDLFGPNVARHAVDALGAALDTTLRVEDVRGRLGEDRFGVLLSEKRLDAPTVIARRLAATFTALCLEGDGEGVLPPALRIGAATLPDDGCTVAALAAKAARRLVGAGAAPAIVG